MEIRVLLRRLPSLSRRCPPTATHPNSPKLDRNLCPESNIPVRRRTVICAILITVALAILFLWFDLKLSRSSTLQFGVSTVTNQFGFPVAQLTFTNRLDESIYVMLETEILADQWAKGYGMRTILIAPRSSGHATFDHPVAEGKWRVAITWSKTPPRNRIYFFLARHCPRIAQCFEQQHHDYTSPIEAWQPPELRNAHK
jgi:hypothetical protein